MTSNVRYSVIVPVFNEEEVLRETYRRLSNVMSQTNDSYELIFIDDGSSDQSEQILTELCTQDQAVQSVHFSRNFGHQVAITAGMDLAQGDAIIVIDADLQDPPELILKMIDKWQEGYEVVYAKRTEREGETPFKRLTAAVFYRLLYRMTDVEIPVDTGDFRLIDRSVCEQMKDMKEQNRFVRGLVSWVGFRQTAIAYKREERWAGETKYPLKKMLKLSIDAITSFSYRPLKMATYLGWLLAGGSFSYLILVLLQAGFSEATVPGWASIISLILFFNGVLFIFLGLLGEYIGRIYDESKSRPLYIIKAHQNEPKNNLKHFTFHD
ncbi:glycosyltransferase family 2 protein [Hazenella sp. IB182357]|uniref:Glycosyltransferase family 2 protein n=1 Tax=Polycladospora coralii TaxID=2771432 RepID=A0A926NB31_9BACL|nr:glycosyltransferase family 2 protein [Polycladospora coralii]MBD1373282.1 glycosyltransferase family 2 protein [Polycladospora coralii]MBS7528897.1 glycosyltransferase family 2 protein [Polycladospora coralii]